MKKFILIIILSTLGADIFSQDIITMTSGEERQAIVKKVGISTIEYVRFDNQSGALYEVLKSDVSKIKYQNGVEELFQPINQDASKNAKPTKGEFTDDRDSTVYKYVVIGKQTWMAENLKYKIGESKCYYADGTCDDMCGRYYNFEEAIKACPGGWHLPTDNEWIDLEIEVGMNESEASKKGWRGTRPGQAPKLLRGGNTGLDLPMCGDISASNSDNIILKKNDIESYKVDGCYWTASANGIFAYFRKFSSKASINRQTVIQTRRFPIRCVKDY